MELLDDRAYLEPPDNEAKPALQCYFCDADIYEGDDYYVLNGFDCCEECLDVHFKFTAELPDYEAEMAIINAQRWYPACLIGTVITTAISYVISQLCEYIDREKM